jgi:GTPase SAR1 family protein
MILIIYGPQGSGKTTLLNAIAGSTWSPEPDIIPELPEKKPGHLSLFTITTLDNERDLPKWIIGRKDVLMISAPKFNNRFPTTNKTP